MRLPTARQVLALLPRQLVEKVPRDHHESDAAFRRRRKVVAGVSVVGAALLGTSLKTRPASNAFYGLTGAVAATWVAGGIASGPLHLGWLERGWITHDEPHLARPVVLPVLTGAGAFGVFYGCALVCREIPVLRRAIASILQYANEGNPSLVMLTTLANGAAEEVFFRGALYAAAGVDRPVLKSTAVYALATTATGNPALVLASGVMGTLFGVQRQVTGGIQAPLLTHLTWSVLMLRYLPPLFSSDDARKTSTRG